MKFALAVLFLSLGLVSAHLRLPLPKDIQARHPHLMTEPINTDADFVKVVGGSAVSDGEARHQIAMLRSGSFICGGSLIGASTVLTAAHCVYGYENRPTSFSVRYNTLDRTSGPTLAVAKVNRHPSYSSNTIDYDIATFSLASPFSPGTNAAVVELAKSRPADDSAVQVTGWGRLSSGGTLPTKLQKADTLKVVSKAECQKRWGSTNTITDRMLCAHSTTQSACNGDSGGPLTQNNVLVGVVSWGSSSCLHATYPNVYASVADLADWIAANP
uniref:Ale o 9 allergen n=1 Tax=Aleuroglyphus ovatus TaxID=212130 RepID=A7UNU2_ALEOV|nr:Ale o 9 allergen [Aleuroglyphus ovatus]